MYQSTFVILGHARHGKDEFAACFCKNMNLFSYPSSFFACEKIIYPWYQANRPTEFLSLFHCYVNRMHYRTQWFKLICEYNQNDKTRLVRECLAFSPVYIGLRSNEELQACRDAKLFDHYIWIDAAQRCKLESYTSNTVSLDLSYMTYIDNNKTLTHLHTQAKNLATLLKNRPS